MTGICCSSAATTSGLSFFDGGRGNDDIRAVNMFGGMTGINLNTQAAQMLGNRISRLIRTGNFKAQIVQDFGDTAHADAADTDKMDVGDSIFHHDVAFRWIFDA